MTCVLVTGGAGFIGSNLVDGLLTSGHAVRVLDDLSTGRRENLEHCSRDIDFIEGDVRDVATMRDAVAGCGAVVHLAAVASVQASFDDPDGVEAVNVGGTVNVLEAVRAAGGGRVILASSCSVYGDSDALPIDEATPTRPLSPYAAGKLAAEEHCRAFAAARGSGADADAAGRAAAGSGVIAQVDTLCLRFFNVYGPRQSASSEYAGVIAAFLAAAAADSGCTVHGDGGQTRDFIYVHDLVRAIIKAVEREEPFGGVPLNAGTGVETSVMDIVHGARDASGAALPVTMAAPREGDIRRSRANVSAIERELDWRSAIAFARGIALTWQWWRERGAATR
jgi:UDP-glucose 4-epimerase